MLQDPLADVLCVIKNAERVGKKDCIVKFSKLAREVLKIMKIKGYISYYEFINDGKSGKLRIELNKKIIDTNVIKPRFSVRVDEFNKWERRFLPSRDLGFLIVTTSKGVVDHETAQKMKVGGKLLAYVY